MRGELVRGPRRARSARADTAELEESRSCGRTDLGRAGEAAGDLPPDLGCKGQTGTLPSQPLWDMGRGHCDRRCEDGADAGLKREPGSAVPVERSAGMQDLAGVCPRRGASEETLRSPGEMRKHSGRAGTREASMEKERARVEIGAGGERCRSSSGKGPCEAAGRARASLGRQPLTLQRRAHPGLLCLALRVKPIPAPLSPGDRRLSAHRE